MERLSCLKTRSPDFLKWFTADDGIDLPVFMVLFDYISFNSSALKDTLFIISDGVVMLST